MSESTEALVPASSLKPPACALAKWEDLEAKGDKAVATLRALSEGGTLSTEVRQQVQALVNLANPKRKGLDENVAGEWQIPEILIKQPTTEMQGALPENIKNGDLFAAIQRKACLGIIDRPLKFRVLFEYESNVKFVQGEKAPVCSSPDAKLGSPQGECAKCPDLPMGKQPGGWSAQKPTDCSYNICFIVIDEKFENVYEIRFSKTSLKAGRALDTLARASKNNAWDKLFSLETEKQTNDQGTYYTFKVAPAGTTIIDAEHDKVCDALCDVYSASREKMLHRYYAGALNASHAAQEGERGFDGAGLAGGLGGEGVEPEFTEEPAKASAAPAAAGKPHDKSGGKDNKGGAARKSSQPM